MIADTPASTAASELDAPRAIAVQNRTRCSLRPARGRPGDRLTPVTSDAQPFGLLIATLLDQALRRPPESTKDLRPIYTATDVDTALEALEAFDQKWGKQLSPVVKAWRENWEYVIPFLAFPPDVRRVIYTTNPIEALNRQLRKAIKTKGHFPNEEAAKKLIYLAIMNATPKWTKVAGWTKALLAFKIQFGDRLPD